jgi:chemosensory pili system protein ChpA (sensor histidine kinase/response regulator)
VQVDIPLELDLGPLAWVKDEVVQTLGRARTEVEAIIAGTAAPEAGKRAHDEIHQTSGAFELIGIEGLATYTREIERHLKAFNESPQTQPASEVLGAVERALRRLTSHLEEVFSGAPCKPTVLTREYAALHRLRGSEAGASDLFFPDLNRKPAKLEGVEPIAGDRLPSYLLGARRGYEKGLLSWLRGDKAGLATMREHVTAVERAFPLPAQRSFWWSVSGLFDAIRVGGVGETVGVKQLAARIDLQLRRFMEGSTKVSDRLRREVLFHIGRAENAEGRAREVQSLYGLKQLLPAPGTLRNGIDYVALRPNINALAEKISEIRAGWQRTVSGQGDSRDGLRADCASASKLADALQRPNLANLLSTLAEVVPSSAIESIPDKLAVEFSSALLFADTALSNFAGDAAAYETEAASIAEELHVAAHGLSDDTHKRAIPQITRRAQERESVRTLLFEVRENLTFVESALDAWVRGNAPLQVAPLSAKLAQTIGVFAISDQVVAGEHVRALDADLAALSAEMPASEQTDLVSRLAEKLSVLGFYVDAKEKQPDVDVTHLLKPVQSPVIEEQEISAYSRDSNRVDRGDTIVSVESDVERQRKELASLVARIQGEPHDAQLRTEISSRLNQLLQDAKLLGNGELVSQIRQAMSALEKAEAETVSSDVIALTQTLAQTESMPVPETSTQTQALLAKDEFEQDEALTEIYLEEATEIMESLRGYVQTLSSNPGDQETLISTRRSFHTLKGSGRMVGFIELGDCAWEVERHLNERISHETPLTVADRALLSCAQSEFDKWIAAIKLDVRASRGLDRTVLDAALRAANANPEPPKPSKPTAVAPVAPSPVVSNAAPSMPNDPGLSLMQFDSFLNLAPTPSPKSDSANSFNSSALLGSGAAAAAVTGTAFAMTAAPQLDGLLPEDFFLEAAIEDALNHNVNDVVVPAPAASIEQALSPAAPSLPVEDHEGLEAPVFAPYVAETPAPVQQSANAAARELPAALHAIMTEEAAGHLAVLTAEVERMQMDEAMGPSDAMIRAAHTLKGMHLSVGMEDIGSLAGDLEAALIALKNESRSDDYLPAVATAVAALQIQCQCLRDRVSPDEADAELVNIARDSLASFNINKPARSADDYIYANESVLADLKAIETEPSDFQFAAPPALVEAAPVQPAIAANEAAEEQLIAHELEHAIHSAEVLEMPASAPAPIALESSAADFAAQLSAATMIAGGGMATAYLATPTISPPAFKPSMPTAFSEPAPSVVAQPPVVSPPAVSKPALTATTSMPASFSGAMRNVDVLAGIRDDLELTVLPIFLEEAQELFPAASAQVRQWREDPKDVNAKQSLMRTMHTIKGSARMAGAMRVGELAHQLESRLEEDERKLVVSPALFEALEFDLDRIAFLLDRLERGESDTPLPGTEAAEPVVAVVEAVEVEESIAPAAALAAEIPAAQNVPILSNIPENPEHFDVTEIYANAVNAPELPVAAKPAAPFVIQKAAADNPIDVTAWLEGDQAAQQQVLRVRSDAVERLADETGEMSISRSRAESELKALRSNLNELTGSVVRLRTQVREIEIQAETQIQSRLTQVQDESTSFDPLEFDRFTRFQELTRSLAEGVNDVQTVQQSFVSSLDAADSALNSQARIARSLQSQLQSIRTVPFASLRERLYRTLRQSARDLNKRANMDIRGGDLSIDRSVLERLAPLVEHVLRNSLAHGIELPNDRLAKGKNETGEILIDLRQQGNLVELTITDDGRGFDIAAIRNKAISQGLAKEHDALTDAQWIEHIFLPGFTTASEITSIAGRGVGMDVVRTEIGALGGRVEIRAEHTAGAKFVLFVPLTLTLLNVVMVQIGVHRYGIPAAMVEAVKTLKRADFETAKAAGEIQHGRERVALVSMHHWLGETPQLRDDKGDQVLVIRSGNRAVALDADAVQGNQEVVLKRMGPQLSRVQGLVGVTLLGDGDIVLLYDPIQLVSVSADAAARMANDAIATGIPAIAQNEVSALPSQESSADPIARAPSEVISAERPALRVVPSGAGNVVQFRQPVQAEKPLVLVVDDSLTVRKITTRFLEREGFRVLSAKDGMDALAVLSEHKPTVILLDIEMPRMDGFEFTRAAKGDAELKKIPIIMITSRTAEKHRNHAAELGVNVYLGKPYQDEELLRNINMFVAK